MGLVCRGNISDTRVAEIQVRGRKHWWTVSSVKMLREGQAVGRLELLHNGVRKHPLRQLSVIMRGVSSGVFFKNPAVMDCSCELSS